MSASRVFPWLLLVIWLIAYPVLSSSGQQALWTQMQQQAQKQQQAQQRQDAEKSTSKPKKNKKGKKGSGDRSKNKASKN